MAKRWTKKAAEALNDAIRRRDGLEVNRIMEEHGGRFAMAECVTPWFLCLKAADVGIYRSVFGSVDVARDERERYWRISAYNVLPKPNVPLRFLSDIVAYRARIAQDRLQETGEFLRLLCEKGHAYEEQFGDADLALLCVCFPDDVELVEMLLDAGLAERDHDDLWLRMAVLFLLAGKHFDMLDFLLCQGIRLPGCPLNGAIPAESLGYCAERGLGFRRLELGDELLASVDRRDEACTPELLSLAFELGLPIDELEDVDELWPRLLAESRVDLGAVLLDGGYGFPDSGLPMVLTYDPATLDWLVEHGAPVLGVDARCPRDVLLRAAHLGLPPASDKASSSLVRNASVSFGRGDFEVEMPQIFSLAAPKLDAPCIEAGMRAVCDSLDAEVIEAFLRMGIRAGVDPSAALESGRDDLVELYAGYGIGDVPRKIASGARYITRDVHSNRIAEIPEGVRRIEPMAFERVRSRLAEIRLPSTLETIGFNAFYGIDVPVVALPPSVRAVDRGAFCGARRIEVYDSIDPDARSCEDHVDPAAGLPNSELGLIGVGIEGRICGSVRDARGWDYEMVVKSSASGEALYRVWMPMGSASDDVRCVLASSWGRGASFAFERLDAIFEALPGSDCKTRTAINRLTYPVSLSDAARSAYERHLSRSGIEVIDVLAETDDIDAFDAIVHCGFLKGMDADLLFRRAGRAPGIQKRIRDLAV